MVHISPSGLFVTLALISVGASTAKSEILDIPGGAFRSSLGATDHPVLDVDPMVVEYYTDVTFPGSGCVCGISMVYQDASPELEVAATLIRGVLTVGKPFTFLPEVTMASLISSGVSQNLKRATTNRITDPKIQSVSSIYHINVHATATEDGPWFVFPKLLAVQIDWRYPACPPLS
jgi:hypothetical protein